MSGAGVVAESPRDTYAADIFEASTARGARTPGRDDIGRLVPGAKADLVLIAPTHPQMRPAHDPLRSLVCCAAERAVGDVFVDGVQPVADREVLTIDYAAATAEPEEAQKRAAKGDPRARLGWPRGRRNRAAVAAPRRGPIRAAVRPIRAANGGMPPASRASPPLSWTSTGREVAW